MRPESGHLLAMSVDEPQNAVVATDNWSMAGREEVLESGHRSITGSAVELAVVAHERTVVVQGPQELVERYVAGDQALSRATASRPSSVVAAAAMALVANAIGGAAPHHLVFQLDDVGLTMFENGTLVAEPEGYVRRFGRGADGLISVHGEVRPLAAAPHDVLTAQMALTTLALIGAVREAQDAVARVEQKVDGVQDLVDGERAAQILELYRSLARRADHAGDDGSMADADWHSIEDCGIKAEQQIEGLRLFITDGLTAAEGDVHDRAGARDALDDARDVSESLALLVVAQASLFVYEQLRLSWLGLTEPDRLGAAIIEARGLLAPHVGEDNVLRGRLRGVLAERGWV